MYYKHTNPVPLSSDTHLPGDWPHSDGWILLENGWSLVQPVSDSEGNRSIW
jgi:hypothetical protein